MENEPSNILPEQPYSQNAEPAAEPVSPVLPVPAVRTFSPAMRLALVGGLLIVAVLIFFFSQNQLAQSKNRSNAAVTPTPGLMTPTSVAVSSTPVETTTPTAGAVPVLRIGVTIQPTLKPTSKPVFVTPSVAKAKPTATPVQTAAPTAQPVATTGTIRGHVTQDGQSVAYATVELWCLDNCALLSNGVDQTVQADGAGNYSFNSIKPHAFKIRAQFSNTISDTADITVEAGKTISKDFTLHTNTTAVPNTTIVTGPAARTNSGDPANFYCTNIHITVTQCCANLQILMSYDNPNNNLISSECQTSKDTYFCSQLSSGAHTFYYKTSNGNCGNEAVKSTSFNVP